MKRTSRALFVGIPLILALALLAAVGLTAPTALARNVDLATLPPRDSVQLTIYNSEDLTLVREMRSLTLKKGINRIQYSWANTLIDPTSVEIRALEQEDQIEILDTTFLGDKAQHLIWNIQSKIEGQVKFMVTYFTSGISWSADYVVLTNPAETEMSMDGYVQIFNNSGEDYEKAQVRLVVGVVNLVEKIRELAQRRGIPVPRPGAPEHDKLREEAVMDQVAQGEKRAGDDATRPAEIIKEGLSEYFIYTIEGRQTVAHQWSKRMLSFTARQVTFDILYRLRPHQYGPLPIRFFLLKNDAEHKLGTTPLPDGVVRTFRDNGRDGLSFLGQQKVAYVPIKADIELNVGTDDEVNHLWTRTRVERFNFSFNINGQVVGWDERQFWSEEVWNHKTKPIRMEVRHVLDGHIDFKAEQAKLHDYHTVEFTFDVKAREKFTWHYAYVMHNGINAKQSRIELK